MLILKVVGSLRIIGKLNEHKLNTYINKKYEAVSLSVRQNRK